MKTLPKIFTSLLVTGVIASSALLFSNAFFSDTESSTDNTFQAGKLDLLINDQNDPSALVNITDLKPGDDYIINKTLKLDNNPGYVWMHLKDILDGQGTQTEPEELEEGDTPKSDLQNYLEYDLTVNGNVLIDAASHIILPDAVSCWIPLGEIPGGTDIVMEQSFHFDPSVTNWAQGDTLTFTEEFYAVQSRNNPNPAPPPSTTGRIWDPNLKKCVSLCQTVWASGSEQNNQGKRKDGTNILADRTDPNTALVAQSIGNPDDNPVVAGSFFSLGFNNGSLVLTFTDPVHNISGPDLKVFEVTGGSYPQEKVKIEAWDGSNWVELTPSLTRDGEFDLGDLFQASKFHLTEVSDINLFEPTADGYDLDGLKAYCSY